MISTSLVPFLPFHRITVIQQQQRKTDRLIPARKITSLMRRDEDDQLDGRNKVDESMLILRRRIHEMKIADKNYEPPPEWMWWEKQVYGDYDAFICDVMGMLQSRLMETRPAAVLAFSAILVLSLPISAATVMFHVARIFTAAGTIP